MILATLRQSSVWRGSQRHETPRIEAVGVSDGVEVERKTANLDWLLSCRYNAGSQASKLGKVFTMPQIGDNELKVIYLKRLGYGFKSIGKQIGRQPFTVRRWLIRAGFSCNAGKTSPAFRLTQKKQIASRTTTEWNDEWRGVVHEYLGYMHRGTLNKNNPYKSGTLEYKRYWITINTGKRCRPRSEYLESLEPVNLPRKKMVKALRRKLTDFIKSTSRRYIHLFGCSAHFMRRHIECQFKGEMTWEDRGKWHIDHIRPCASFEFVEKSDALICFNWKNLRPVFVSVNNRKGAKWRGELWAQGKPTEKRNLLQI
jgi:hypothetical protein